MQLFNEISSAQYFSLIVDEATDVAHNEQECIAVHWVDSSYNVQEAALRLVQLPDTDNFQCYQRRPRPVLLTNIQLHRSGI